MSPARTGGVPLGQLLAGWVDVSAKPACEVRGLCHDSRKLRPGDLFIALAGTRSHGMSHAASAVASGACAILFDPAGGGAALAEAGFPVPCIAVERLDQLLGHIADRFFAEPSARLDVVGITGTNGKTSCSHFIAQALGAGEPAAVIGTLGCGVPGVLRPTAHTTPDAIEVHSLLARLAAEGIAHVAMEASSHGLAQGRTNGVRFSGGLFTNLSRDHLDYHATMEAYLEAKLRLVSWPGLGFLAFNLDDPCYEAILAKTPGTVRKFGFSLDAEKSAPEGVSLIRALQIQQGQGGVCFEVAVEGGRYLIDSPLYGDFNVANLLGSFAVLLGLGIEPGDAAQRLSHVTAVPGRMERFASADGKTAVVDYAHTPDALDKALVSLRRHCLGELWVVFGCGGDRDRGKRPLMGEVAVNRADRVVLTDDNPRSEDGEAIIEEILQGCMGQAVPVIRDRRSAIAYASAHIGPGDVLLVAGKGHEDTQEVKGKKEAFSDRAVIQALLDLPTEENLHALE